MCMGDETNKRKKNDEDNLWNINASVFAQFEDLFLLLLMLLALLFRVRQLIA